MRYAGKGLTIAPPPALQGCFSGSKRVTDLPERVTNGSQAKSGQAEPPTSGTFLPPLPLGARSLQEGRGGLKFGERAMGRQKE